MSKELVSIVIPTYGRPAYLKRAIESCLKQSYENLEILVVDDNNPDTDARKETESVMRDFFGNPKVTYLQHECNKNGSAARNTGWKASKGSFITFLDDDDILEETKIEKQVACLNQLDDSWGMCYTGYRLIKESGEIQISSEKRSGSLHAEALMRTLFMGSGSNLLLRMSVVNEINGYDASFKRNQDIEFLARATQKYKLAYIDEILLEIRQEGTRAKRTFDEIEAITLHYLEKMKPYLDALSEHDKKRVIAVISLERFRLALYAKLYKRGFKILKENHVSYRHRFKYFIYLLHRYITHKSYGFSLR